MPVPDDLLIQETRAKIFASRFGILTGLLTPLTIAGATFWFNYTQLQMSQSQTCIKESLEISSQAAGQNIDNTGNAERRRAIFASHAELLGEQCRKVGITLPKFVREELVAVAEEAKSPAVAASAESALRADAKSTGTSDALNLAVAANNAPAARVYFHISSADQRSAAVALQERLSQENYDGQPIIVPGVELVGKGDNSLRCFRQADCSRAVALLASLQKLLKSPILRLSNLSSTFEKSKKIRDNHYELWLGSGPIELAGDGPT